MNTRTIPTLAALAWLSLLVPVHAALPPAVPGAGTSPADDAPLPSLAPMIKRVAPAIVNIATRGSVRERLAQNPLLDDPAFQRFFAVPQPQSTRVPPFQSTGSGVIFDARKGYILTNAHVIESASEVTVTLADGRNLKADIVGTDEPTDLAVLRVKPVRLSEIELGDSSRLEVGDFVVAIGNPFGLQNTVTSGIVSGLGRSSLESQGYEDFIQTDASINPGNSGGALVNLRGELVGISTAILARDGGNRGIGFAIPVNMARAIVEQLLQFGSVKRGLLGLDTYPVSPDVAQALGLPAAQGALVTQVLPGSSAESAGIASGDVIISINRTTVKSPADVRNTVALLRAGDSVDIGLLRDGRMQHVSALIAEPPEPQPDTKSGDINPGLDGATLSDAPSGGVLVRGVDAGSAAAESGLHVDDIIIGLNQARITHLAQLRARAAGATTLVLEVQRGRGVVLVPVVNH